MNKNVIEKMYSSTGNVELAEVKVDLGLVDDIASMTQKANEISKQLGDAVVLAEKMKAEYDKAVTVIRKAYPIASKFQDAEDKLWEKSQKAADDLGLKRDDIKGWKQFADAGLAVNSAINGANNYMS